MPETASTGPLGIFGGTFDPLHYGHLRLAEEAVEALRLTAVRWIPAGRPALRSAPRAGAEHRLAMVCRAIAGNPRFMLDAAEIEAECVSYTVPTLERLRRDDVCGGARPLVLLTGADTFARLEEWHRWQALFDLAHIAVACRPGYVLQAEALPPALAREFRRRSGDRDSLTAAPAGRIVAFAMTPLDISATRIRQLLANSASPRYLLPEAVIDYIHRQRLYTEK